MKKKILTIGASSLLLDRLTKAWLGNSQNKGLFFWPVNQRVIVIISCLAVLILGVWLVKVWKAGKEQLSLGLSLIVLGGLSNVYDRLVYGYVIDWVHSPISVFNLADVMIVGGSILVILRRR